eukprot:scaffold63219_cov33-Tisochrysis_lutea.AAC.4
MRGVGRGQHLEAARQGYFVATAEARACDKFIARRVELLEHAEFAAGARQLYVTTTREGERRVDDSVAL